jgi:DNA-binding NarL/FixJ family response regulator
MHCSCKPVLRRLASSKQWLITRLQPDVVLLDLRLSAGSGLAVLKHVKIAWPAIKVAVMTSHAQPDYRERCMELGADRFYDKQKDMPACLGQLSDWTTPSSPDDAPRPAELQVHAHPVPYH